MKWLNKVIIGVCLWSLLLCFGWAASKIIVKQSFDSKYNLQSRSKIHKIADTSKFPLHLKYAMQYLGTHEGTNNSGNFVDYVLEAVNIKANSHASWCAGFVARMMKLAKVTYPTKFSALAQAYIDKTKSIKAYDVWCGKITLKDGWYLVIWKKGNTISGHIGFLIVQDGKLFYTIEGNTSSGTGGSQDNGDMVAFRTREIQPYAYMKIVYFTPILYN